MAAPGARMAVKARSGKFRLRDLVKATGLTPRAIRYYAHWGLLPPAFGRGSGTNYGEEHLLRLRAVQRLQRERLSLTQIRARLGKISAADLAALAATEGGASIEPKSPPGDAKGPSGIPAVPATGHFPGAESWERICLLPGLELHVQGGAGPLVLRTAEEIRQRYSVAPLAPPRVP